MKFLFWILAILSIAAGWISSLISCFVNGLDLAGTGFGTIITLLGMVALPVSLICAIVGFIKLRKGFVKKAVTIAAVGLAYCAVIFVGYLIDEAVDTIRLEKDIAAYNEQLYGEDWDAPPAIEGIPELYQEELNKLYVAVRDSWSADQLAELSVGGLAAYYGEDSLENIGFALVDLTGDNVDELLIGTTAPVEEGGTAIVCIYSDPQNPFRSVFAAEGEVYYLHFDEAAGTYIAEIGGEAAAWVLEAVEGESMVDITYREGAMDPTDRLMVEMIPFSDYK